MKTGIFGFRGWRISFAFLSSSPVALAREKPIRIIKQTADYTYQFNKDYESWQIDQRRYVPLTDKEVAKRAKKVAKRATNPQSPTPLKSATDAGLQELAQFLHKDIFKDIYKDISLKERIFERLKDGFPGQDEQQLKDLIERHPERADYFLYLCESSLINPVYVKNPIAYITSLRPIEFPDLRKREAMKKEAEKKALEEKARRQKEMDELRLEKDQIKKLVSSFVKSIVCPFDPPP